MATGTIPTWADHLWNGEKSGGDTISVPERWKNYRFLAFRLSHYSYGSSILFIKVYTSENPVVMFLMSGQAASSTIQTITMTGTLDTSTNVLTLGSQLACNQTSSGNSIFSTNNMKITDIYGID